MLAQWALGREVLTRGSREQCLRDPLLWPLGGQLCCECCQFISFPSTKAEVTFNDFINRNSAGFWPWGFQICSFLFFPAILPGCLKEEFYIAVRRKSLAVLWDVKFLSFLQMWPIVTQDMRWDFDFIVTFFPLNYLRACLPSNSLCVCVSQRVLSHNCFNAKSELFYPCRFFLSKR